LGLFRVIGYNRHTTCRTRLQTPDDLSAVIRATVYIALNEDPIAFALKLGQPSNVDGDIVRTPVVRFLLPLERDVDLVRIFPRQRIRRELPTITSPHAFNDSNAFDECEISHRLARAVGPLLKSRWALTFAVLYRRRSLEISRTPVFTLASVALQHRS